MPPSGAEVPGLDSWLDYISTVHPSEIELGLDRVRTVANNMGLGKVAPKIVIVAGTNGKGSCVTLMEALLIKSGRSVASYTSPHLSHYTERIKIDGKPIDEASICIAFSHIDECREGVSLSYFEFSTLAALWIFCQANIDVALLEVGLGGRLDAVNIVDADVTVISSIALDHQDWLGDNLDSIGREKAGILRSGVPLVYGDAEPVGSIIELAQKLGAPLYLINKHFQWEITKDDCHWRWSGCNENGALSVHELAIPALHLNNASIALQTLSLLNIDLTKVSVQKAFKTIQFQGRQEHRLDTETGVDVILDVAHNPAAAKFLAAAMSAKKAQYPEFSQISVVIAVMADKDIEGIALSLESCVDIWYISQVEESRCMASEEVEKRLQSSGHLRQWVRTASVVNAYRQACKDSCSFARENPGKKQLVVVMGSFYTVAAVRNLSDSVG
ncbi:MAG: bifunctional tetrahydrofolate synthase/dihydrofolate synthase [Pseudohongiellaceae bacterium]